MTLTFTVRGVPAPQGSFKAFISKSTGRAFMQQANARTMPWRQEVAGVAMAVTKAPNATWPTSKPVSLTVTFYLPRPAGHFGKKGLRPSAPKFPAKKPDLSKLVRAVEDALSGIVYDDDARICWTKAVKLYDDGGGPRAQFLVEEAE